MSLGAAALITLVMATSARKKKKKADEPATVASLNLLPPELALPAPPFVLLPERATQTVRSLVPPHEAFAAEAAAVVAFVATAPLPDAATTHAAASALSRGLLELAAATRDAVRMPPPLPRTAPVTRRARRKEPKKPRVASARGELIGNYALSMPRLAAGDARELAAIDRYYANDRLDDVTGFEHRDPRIYPAFWSLEQAHTAEHAQRHRALERLGDVPLPVAPREFSADQLKAFRFPPRDADPTCAPPRPADRTCRNRDQCLFARADTLRGYVGREFYVTDTPPAPGVPLGLCLDCTLRDYALHVDMCLSEGRTPFATINTFVVAAGEYARHMLLGDEHSADTAPGIAGHVPRYSTAHRAWLLITPADRIRYALPVPAVAAFGDEYYWGEINVRPPPPEPLVRSSSSSGLTDKHD